MKVVKNSNAELVHEIETKLKQNDGYCPCRLTKTPENKCMCEEFRQQIFNRIEGEGHCGLYIAVRD